MQLITSEVLSIEGNAFSRTVEQKRPLTKNEIRCLTCYNIDVCLSVSGSTVSNLCFDGAPCALNARILTSKQ